MRSKQTDFQAYKGVRHSFEAWKSGYLDFLSSYSYGRQRRGEKEQKKKDEKASEKEAPKVFFLCCVSNS